MRFLPAREWGALSLTCVGFNYTLGACRVSHLASRLMRRQDSVGLWGDKGGNGDVCLVGGLELCGGRKEAQVCCFYCISPVDFCEFFEFCEFAL